MNSLLCFDDYNNNAHGSMVSTHEAKDEQEMKAAH
jgi:hypothetical protein